MYIYIYIYIHTLVLPPMEQGPPDPNSNNLVNVRLTGSKKAGLLAGQT